MKKVTLDCTHDPVKFSPFFINKDPLKIFLESTIQILQTNPLLFWWILCENLNPPKNLGECPLYFKYSTNIPILLSCLLCNLGKWCKNGLLICSLLLTDISFTEILINTIYSNKDDYVQLQGCFLNKRRYIQYL